MVSKRAHFLDVASEHFILFCASAKKKCGYIKILETQIIGKLVGVIVCF